MNDWWQDGKPDLLKVTRETAQKWMKERKYDTSGFRMLRDEGRDAFMVSFIEKRPGNRTPIDIFNKDSKNKINLNFLSNL